MSRDASAAERKENPTKERFACRMRHKPTRLERRLETCLAIACEGRYFVYRQWIQSGYIFDFYIRELKLAFEADGPLHDADYDRRRDDHMARIGIRTIRFPEQALEDAEAVERDIRHEIQQRLASI